MNFNRSHTHIFDYDWEEDLLDEILLKKTARKIVKEYPQLKTEIYYILDLAYSQGFKMTSEGFNFQVVDKNDLNNILESFIEEIAMNEIEEKGTINGNVPEAITQQVADYLGEENIRYFKHIRGLKGEINTILRLNRSKKGIPFHPIHLREGMQIRNFLRSLDECKDWHHLDFENEWITILDILVDNLEKEKYPFLTKI